MIIENKINEHFIDQCNTSIVVYLIFLFRVSKPYVLDNFTQCNIQLHHQNTVEKMITAI